MGGFFIIMNFLYISKLSLTQSLKIKFIKSLLINNFNTKIVIIYKLQN